MKEVKKTFLIQFLTILNMKLDQKSLFLIYWNKKCKNTV